MKTEILQDKLERYLNGVAMPAETRQIQTWLSCISKQESLAQDQKQQLETGILKEIQQETSYHLFYPKKEAPWWEKITAFF